MAWCIQWRTKGSPVAASDWAVSHSWCGTAVEVDGRPQLAHGKRRALDVPAGTPRTPQRLPEWLVGRRGLPEHEVERIPLVGIAGVATVDGREPQHLVTVVVADLAEAVPAPHVEVDRTTGLIGVAPVEDHADEPSDVGDGGGGTGLAEAGQQLERLHVIVEASDLAGGKVEIVDPKLPRLAEEVVIDVGDVADAAGFVAPVPQAPLEDVVGQVGGGVAEVGGVVGRDAARIHGDELTRFERDDRLASRVVEAHRRILRRRPGFTHRRTRQRVRQIETRTRGCR